MGIGLLVTGELSYAGRILAEQAGLPWLATALAPFSLFSAYDPPVLAPAPVHGRVDRGRMAARGGPPRLLAAESALPAYCPKIR